MKALILAAALCACGCATPAPLTDEEVNNLSEDCLLTGGTPKVIYAPIERYEHDFSWPIEVRCIGGT